MPEESQLSKEEREIYDKGLRALEEVLETPDPKSKVKAAELAFKLVGKLKENNQPTAPQMQIARILQVIQAPITEPELKEAERFIETGRTSQYEAAVQGTAADSEQREENGTFRVK